MREFVDTKSFAGLLLSLILVVGLLPSFAWADSSDSDVSAGLGKDASVVASNSAEPAEPQKPVKSVELAEIEKPAEPARPADTAKPVKSAKPQLKTKVSGVDFRHSTTSYKKAPSDKVTVCPAYGRSVSVQAYDASSKKWVTMARYKTKRAYKSVVKIKFGSYWKHHYKSTYRLHVGAVAGKGGSYEKASKKKSTKPTAAEFSSRGAKAYTSKKISITYNPVSAKSAIVIDASTKKVVFEKNPSKRCKIASITKLMTAILLTEEYSGNHRVSITREAAKTPWGIGLKAGDQMAVSNLLYAMMLPSANDAATASGIAVSGSTSSFAKKMTSRARSLGCKNTVYKNAHGLDARGAYSTAYDQALIGAYVATSSNTKAIRDAASKKSCKISSVAGRVYSLKSTNKLLGTRGFTGLKTGTTDDAGPCFCGTFTASNGRTYVSVVLGSKAGKRFTDTQELAKLAKHVG